MGDIGPARVRYEVLPAVPYGIDEADRWTVPVPVRAGAAEEGRAERRDGAGDPAGDEH